MVNCADFITEQGLGTSQATSTFPWLVLYGKTDHNPSLTFIIPDHSCHSGGGAVLFLTSMHSLFLYNLPLSA
jgi:hypothetical protein